MKSSVKIIQNFIKKIKLSYINYSLIIFFFCFLSACFNHEIKEKKYISYHLTINNLDTLYYEYKIDTFTNKKRKLHEVGDDKDLSINWYNNFALACEIADHLKTSYSKKNSNDFIDEYEKYSELSFKKDFINTLLTKIDQESSIKINTTKHYPIESGYKIHSEEIILNDALHTVLQFISDHHGKNIKFDYLVEISQYKKGELIKSKLIETFVELDNNALSCYTNQLKTDYSKLE